MGLGRGGGRIATQLEEAVAQGGEGAVDAGFGGAGGDVEEATNLVMGEVLKTMQDEDLALFGGEGSEGVLHEIEFVGFGGLLVSRRGAVVGNVGKSGGVSGGGNAFAPIEVVGRNASGEVVDSGGEFAFVAVGVPVFEHTLEDDLNEVLGDLGFAGKSGEKAEEGAVVSFEQVTESRELAGSDGQHEVVVAGVVPRIRIRVGRAVRCRSEGNW